jgi:hypothetical protein
MKWEFAKPVEAKAAVDFDIPALCIFPQLPSFSSAHSSVS